MTVQDGTEGHRIHKTKTKTNEGIENVSTVAILLYQILKFMCISSEQLGNDIYLDIVWVLIGLP